MSKHEVACSTPRVFMRREGAVWMCSCGTIYRLKKRADYDGGYFKTWSKVMIVDL